MDPATLGVLGLVGSAASAGVGAVGALTTASAQAQAAQYQAQVARNNQVIAQQNAQTATAAGAQQGQNQDQRTAQLIGSTQAAQGASGISVTSPTSEAVVGGERSVGQLNSQALNYNAYLQGRQGVEEAVSEGEQAQLDVATAQNATTAGLFQAGASILGGASSFATKWSNYQLKGVFS